MNTRFLRTISAEFAHSTSTDDLVSKWGLACMVAKANDFCTNDCETCPLGTLAAFTGVYLDDEVWEDDTKETELTVKCKYDGVSPKSPLLANVFTFRGTFIDPINDRVICQNSYACSKCRYSERCNKLYPSRIRANFTNNEAEIIANAVMEISKSTVFKKYVSEHKRNAK